MTPHEKIQAIRTALEAHLIERNDTIYVSLAALVAQEHCVLVGPPGTAKSLVSEAIMRCVEDGIYVSRLLHKAMTPDDIFGGMDVKRFQKDGVITHVFRGSACEAHGVFLDEIFKGNTLVLNSLLTFLQERRYEDQSGRHELPIRSVFGASNEFPADKTLDAFYDRFVFRHMQSGYIQSEENWMKLLRSRANKSTATQRFKAPCKITVKEWDEIRAEVESLPLDEPVIRALAQLRSLLIDQGITISDRRAVCMLKALKASAWLDGEPEVGIDDLQILRFVLWITPEQRDKVLAALRTVERSKAAKAIEQIDALLRKRSDIPADPVARDAAVAELLGEIKTLGRDLKERLDTGDFGKRGSNKVKRRAKELGEAYRSLFEEFSSARMI